jgi:N-acetylneuraminic acid mutarotase
MKKTFTTMLLIFTVSIYSFSQNGWTQLADYPGSGSVGVSATVNGGNGLVGTGYYGSPSSNYKDWWEYLPASSSWTQKTSLSGATRYGAKAFTIGNNSYICLGNNGSSFLNDLWQYNTSTNTWVQKANFPGTARYGVLCQATDTKAYIGLGEHDTGGGISDYFSDLYEYNEATNTWAAKASFPGQARFDMFSFLFNNVIYMVGGRSEDVNQNWMYYKQVWAYNIATNTWSQKTNYPGGGSYAFGGFVLGQYAYVVAGYDGSTNYRDFWKFNPQTDTWEQLPDFPGTLRRAGVSFNTGNTGYFGCGYTSGCVKDFWKYEDPSGINRNTVDGGINLYPVPADKNLTLEIKSRNTNEIEIITFYNIQGQMVLQQIMQQDKAGINISGLASGIYIVKVIGTGINVIKKIIKE